MTARGVDPAWLAAIAGWLPDQRWFAGKELTIRSVTVDAAVPITLGGTRAGDVVTFLVVHVAFERGDPQRYALPVAAVSAERSGLTPDDRRVIEPLGGDLLLVDAMALPDTAAIVVAAAFHDDAHTGDGASVRGRPRRERLVAHPAMVRPLSVEQSNSSLMIGTTQIAKLIRRVEPGPNPDVELPGHLSGRFAHVPGLVASLEIALAGADGPGDVLVVHDAIVNEGDLWTIVVERLRRELVGGELVGGEPFGDHHLETARLLGRRTAELHAALAAPVVGDDAESVARAARMRPEAITMAWQHDLVDHLHRSMARTRDALERRAGAGALAGAPDALLARFDRLRTDTVDGRLIRIHGDLHLGQVLSTGGDVVFIDFEGEPGVPIAERLVKRSPLVDVAGLVRSIDYAGRQALTLARRAGTVPDDRFDSAESARASWTARLSGAIVDEYLAAVAPARLLPADPADAQLLLDLHLLDKGLYEIRYELANRPEWVGAPLAAVTEMITR